MVRFVRPEEAKELSDVFKGESLAHIKERQEKGIIALSERGEVRGAATLSVSPGLEGEPGKNLILEYYFVKPKHRKSGVFSEMLDFLRRNSKGVSGIIAQTMVPGMEDSEACFEALGFERLQDGNDIVTFPVKAMEHSILDDERTLNMQSGLVAIEDLLPGEKSAFFKAFSENGLPPGFAPERMPGRLLLDHSFVYLTRKGAFGGFLLTTVLPDGTLYLGALYVKEEHRHMAIVLLSALYERVMLTESPYKNSRIMYATATAEAVKLSQKMLEWCEEDVKVEHTHNYFYPI